MSFNLYLLMVKTYKQRDIAMSPDFRGIKQYFFKYIYFILTIIWINYHLITVDSHYDNTTIKNAMFDSLA